MPSYDVFKEFQNATAHPPEASKLPPGETTPKEQTDHSNVPQQREMPQTTPRQMHETWWTGWGKTILNVLLGILLLLLILLLGWWLWTADWTRAPVTPKVVEKTTMPPGTQKEITQLKKDVNWLKYLLNKAKKELRIEKENHATTKVRLMNALQVKAANEKYHHFLQHAIDQFYKTPLPKGVHKRTLCFTTDKSNRECLQIERPPGWKPGDKPVIRRF